MSKSNLTEIEQGIGSEVDHFVYRVPKKNHDAMVQLNKQFAEINEEIRGSTFNFPAKQYRGTHGGHHQHNQNCLGQPRR